jgi:hypothetical protein
MITLAVLIFQGLVLKAGQSIAWRSIAMIVLISVIAGLFTYGVARAAEPLLPSFSSPVEEHHDEGSHDH